MCFYILFAYRFRWFIFCSLNIDTEPVFRSRLRINLHFQERKKHIYKTYERKVNNENELIVVLSERNIVKKNFISEKSSKFSLKIHSQTQYSWIPYSPKSKKQRFGSVKAQVFPVMFRVHIFGLAMHQLFIIFVWLLFLFMVVLARCYQIIHNNILHFSIL